MRYSEEDMVAMERGVRAAREMAGIVGKAVGLFVAVVVTLLVLDAAEQAMRGEPAPGVHATFDPSLVREEP